MFGNKLDISDLELLSGQKYKAPIWVTAIKSWKLFFIKLFFAWIFSFIIDSFDMFIGYSIVVSYLAIEIVYFNWINNDVYKP